MRVKAAGLVLALMGTLVAVAPTVGASGLHCDGLLATIVVQEEGVLTLGTDGDDVIVGTFGPDQIDAGAGNDTICGHAGDDILIGGPGNDHIQGGNGDDDVRGGDGDDVLFGGKDDDVVRGDGGTDIVLGEQGNDTLIGNIEAEILWPGPGADEIVDEATIAEPDVAEPGDAGPPANDVADDAPADDVADDAGDPPTDTDTDPPADFDDSAPLVTDRVSLLDAGVLRFDRGGTPFTVDVPTGWELLENRPALTVFGPTDNPDQFVNDVLIKRPNALGNPAEAGTFLEDQDAPFDVRDLDAWIAAVPQEIFSSPPTDTTLGGRDAVTFEVRIEDESLCGQGPLCFVFTGNISGPDSFTFEVDTSVTVWVVDMGEFDPIIVLLSDNGNSPSVTEQGPALVNSIAFGDPQPNPLPLVEAPWEIGGAGQAPPGPVEWPLLGGIAVDVPETSFAGRTGANLHTLSNGTEISNAEMQIFTPVADGAGNQITTAADFVAAGEVAGFTSTEVGTVETRLGTAVVVEVEGSVQTGPPVPGEITIEQRGILTEADEQLGWSAPPFARIWLIESDRGLVAFSASLFFGERADLDSLIPFAESILPSLRFVGEPDGQLAQLASDVGFDVNPPGDYLLDFGERNPILAQTTEDALVLPIGPDLMALNPPALGIPDGPPVGVAFLGVDEVITSNDGDTAPVPANLGAHFEADDRLTIEDSGTQLVSGVEAQWWELDVAPGAGFSREGCSFNECVPIFVNNTVGDINIADDFDFWVFEIPDPDGTAYAIVQGPPETRDALFEFTQNVMSGLEVLPVPIVAVFDEGELFGFDMGETLEPGTYFSNEAFSVPFQITTDEDWRFVVAFEDFVLFEDPDRSITGGFQGFGIIEPSSGFADPDTIGGPEAQVTSTIGIPDDLVAWADAIPQLDVLNSGTTEIAGLDARFIDLAITGPADRNGDCGGTSCFLLFDFGPDAWAILEGAPNRFYVIDHDDTSFVIAVESPADEFDQWLIDTEPLLEGITFG